MKNVRNRRTVILSVIKVKMLLAEKNIFSLNEFEIHYTQKKGNKKGSYDGTPKKVWNNKNIDRGKALDMASYFGLNNYRSLLPNSKSPWESLVYDSKRHEPFMTFHSKDPGQLGLIEFENCDNECNIVINQHKVREKCYLTLKGNKGDYYFILLRSNDSQFEVLAPINQKNSKNRNTGGILRYPQEKGVFTFNQKEGTGFRELIAIKTNQVIPFYPCSKSIGRMVNYNSLNRLAIDLTLDQSVAKSISVSIYPFVLV